MSGANASPIGRSHQEMNDWTTPKSIRAQVERYWNSGKLLASMAGNDAERERGSGKSQMLSFPLRLTLRGPASRELSERFDAVRSWIAQLESSAKPPAPRG